MSTEGARFSARRPGRLWLFALLALSLASALSLRWHNLQVSRFAHYAEVADSNRVRVLPVEPPRGEILDRSGERLAINETVHSLRVRSDFAAAALGKIEELRRVLHVPDERVQELLEKRASPVYEGELLLRDQLSEQEVRDFLNWQFLFPEVILESSLARRYPLGDSAGHVIGYVARLSEADAERLEREGETDRYRGARFIGRTGVELMYEDILRGAPGTQYAQIDAHGRIYDRSVRREPSPGKDIHLTLDMRLQRLAESLLAGERGAAVLMDSSNGELLALASSPRPDGNEFVFGVAQERWRSLSESPSKPLIHRAIYGQYAPGSTIKPFLALAALQRGWRDTGYHYESTGAYRIGNHEFRDWKEGGHGSVDIAKSIIRSVNTFYYALADEIGIEDMRKGLLPFGFGELAGVDLDNEKGGVLPAPAWKKKIYGQEWVRGDTIAAGIGQGYMLVTPLQMAVGMAMLANGGSRVRPHVFRDATADSAQAAEFDAGHLGMIRSALADVTRPGGTSPRVGAGAAYGIAGKTGTAQVARLALDSEGERIKNEDLPKHLRDHAWFTGYAPADAPQVAVAVIVENSGSGGRVAGPIARQLLDGYFDSLSSGP